MKHFKGCGNLSLVEGFKILRGSPEEKAQRGQYLLTMGLSCYKWYHSQIQDGGLARMLGPKGGGL